MRTLIVAALIFIPTVASAQSDDGWGDDDWGEQTQSVIDLHGFVEGATGSRVVSTDLHKREFTLGEGRFRLSLTHEGDIAHADVVADFVADDVASSVDVDLREASASVRLGAFDIKAGRQVITWGTGDFLFLNDLFPKDWVSFIIGREDSFLKAPSTAIRLMFASSVVNVDVVWTPIFEPDRTLTGERLSFYYPVFDQRVGEQVFSAGLTPVTPVQRLRNGEFSARLHRRFGPVETALYGYLGFSKQPLGFDPRVNAPSHPRMAAYGASLRSPILGGIGNVEVAYYDSLADRDGRDPFKPNSQLRALVGYERELVAKLNLGLQGYVEHTLYNDRLIDGLPAGAFEPDETRQVTTLRLTYLLLRDTLTLGTFVFVSPTDEDAHVRTWVSYKFSDAFAGSIGANLFIADSPYSFYGQFEDNSNVYLRLRYSL